MIIELYENWDNPPSGNIKPSPYFSGRAKEVESLKHIFLNRIAGSFLIGAPRGIGKTDLIYKSLEQPVKNSKGKLIPIVLDATQLGITEFEIKDPKNQAEIKLTVIKSLIARTYSVCKNILKRDLLKEISILYYQATSKKYEELLISSQKGQDNKKETKEEENKNFLFFSFKKKDLLDSIKIVLPTSILAIPFLISQYIVDPIWKTVVYTILVFIYIFARSFDFLVEKSKVVKTITTKSKETEIMETAEILYLRDASYGNLEHGLKDFLLKLNKNKFKAIFIIDELDKLEKGDTITIVKSFKGLFNHSDALFIFIAADDVFNQILTERSTRSSMSTLFSQRIYISRPNVQDIKDYFKKIIASSSKENTGNFSNYIIYISRMDFYNIFDAIRDEIEKYSDKGRPIIEWINDGEKVRKANKQTVISTLLEEGKYLFKQQSNLSKNESLIDTAYQIAENRTLIEFPKELQIIENEDPLVKLKRQLEYDIAKYMSESQLFDRKSTDKNGVIYYQYSQNNSAGKPFNKLSEKLEYENELEFKLDSFSNFLLDIYNFYAVINKKNIHEEITDKELEVISNLTSLPTDVYQKVKKTNEELTNNPIEHPYNQEEIRALINSLAQYEKDILAKNPLEIIKNSIKDLKVEVSDIANNVNFSQKLPNLTLYINENSPQHMICKSSKDLSFSVILFNPKKSLSSEEVIKTELKTNKIRLLELYRDNDKVKTKNFKNIKIRIFTGMKLNGKVIKDIIKL